MEEVDGFMRDGTWASWLLDGYAGASGWLVHGVLRF